MSKLLGREDIKPHKMRSYLKRRDAEFEQKMAEVLCVHREVQVLKKAAAKSNKSGMRVAIGSYDEKAGIQAIKPLSRDLAGEISLHELELDPGREHPLFITARQRDQSRIWTSPLFWEP
ncbi:hypothetical protein [Rhizobium mayense]|uniref:Uncharacterized protein n=1 Tax=Rhizobium mayense TaxID=1312184 RepID=A0ABT7K4L8_9HYPH|nr:hypothetical protein [Rhizobium mayense]MDL2403558.1 hypothetical protein [Rhizobium mayense]